MKSGWQSVLLILRVDIGIGRWRDCITLGIHGPSTCTSTSTSTCTYQRTSSIRHHTSQTTHHTTFDVLMLDVSVSVSVSASDGSDLLKFKKGIFILVIVGNSYRYIRNSKPGFHSSAS